MSDARQGICPVCGQPIVRRSGSYELGRRGSPPVRWVGKWWHEGTTTEACADPDEWTAECAEFGCHDDG